MTTNIILDTINPTALAKAYLDAFGEKNKLARNKAKANLAAYGQHLLTDGTGNEIR